MSATAGLPVRRLVIPTLITCVLMAILVALGVWQLERLKWKLGLLAEIDHAEASPPIPLSGAPLQFTKVSVQGVLRNDLRALYGVDVHGVTEGSQLIEPLERPGQLPVLVDLGWVPEGFDAPPGGPATVVGYVRVPNEPGLFTPNDDTGHRHFYNLDPAKIGAGLGLPAVAPFTIIAMGLDGIPQPASALPRPPNDHLGYALTWFGLAATLIVTYALFVRKALRP